MTPAVIASRHLESMTRRDHGPPRRIHALLGWAADYLRECGSSSPRVEAEWLLGHTLRMERHVLYLESDRTLTSSELRRFKGYVKERAGHRPVQYITHSTEFMSLPFKLTGKVSIPRPETETLVETVLELSRELGDRSLRILDIGTGSGNVAVSIAYYLPKSHVTAIDVEEEILTVARSNAAANSVADRVEFVLIDINDSAAKLPERLDFVVSNPPYLTPEEWSRTAAEVQEWEPATAFLDGADGLGFLDSIAEKALLSLSQRGFLCVEIGGEHRVEPVKKLLREHGFGEILVRPDLGGTPRVVHGRRG